MALKQCKECGKEVSSKAASCPNCGAPVKAKSSPVLTGCLLVILLIIILGIIGSLNETQKSARSAKLAGPGLGQASIANSGPVLDLVSWNWKLEHGYAIVEGSVKNISSEKLKNVEAMATFYDASGNLITTGDALIEYNPILPGQTSPFRAMATSNPAMKKAAVDFKYLFGGSLAWKDARK